MFVPLFTFSVGIMLAVTICCLWAKKGGDTGFGYNHPHLRHVLHILHHWMFGLALVCICPLMSLFFSSYPIPICFTIGLGLGLFIDDTIFHGFETYFERKIE